jgi:hypothetical protein
MECRYVLVANGMPIGDAELSSRLFNILRILGNSQNYA